MVEYETHKDLFDFLSLEMDLKMQWANIFGWEIVITLTLGSQARQRVAKVWAKNEVQESQFMFLGL
jgi:hypothetical protein